MSVTIYQIDSRRDKNKVKFMGHSYLEKLQDTPNVDSSIYNKIYESNDTYYSLEEIYEQFNVNHPSDYRGHSLSISDVVEVSDNPEIEDGFYYCDTFGFTKIEFNKEEAQRMNAEQAKEMYAEGMIVMLEEMRGETQMPFGLKGTVKFVDDMGQIHMNWENGSSLALNVNEDKFQIVEPVNKITVLAVEPGKYPKVIELEDSLESMQKFLGGYIEEYMPFDDDVAIVCNEEGKMTGSEFNRAIRDENGNIQDIIAGKFFVCYAPIESENFQSMPKELMDKYREKFKYPERFEKEGSEIKAIPYKPVSKDKER